MIDLLLNKEKIEAIDLSKLGELVLDTEFRTYFLENAGKEHYRLLGNISMHFNESTLLDIGTYKGCSALALSLNKTNQIKSFDIRFGLRGISDYPDNVEFIVDDILNEKYKDLVLSSKFIILDTDHDGGFEDSFYQYLISINYVGYLMLDDIHYNTQMKNFWESIEREKYDISEIGHHSGTGLVIFK
jgi:hypothetical protein